MLTTGWACSSGSPDDRWVSNRQLPRHRAGYSDLGTDHGAAKVEQLLWNECNGRVCDTRTIARMRFGVVCPPVNWSVRRTDSFGDPNEQTHPVVNRRRRSRLVWINRSGNCSG
jgi:hypothetical protein